MNKQEIIKVIKEIEEIDDKLTDALDPEITDAAKVIANDTYYWCHILNGGVCLDDCVDCCEEWLKQEHKE